MSCIPRSEYPRPQFRRSGWINLNGEWYFAFDDKVVGLMKRWQDVASGDLRSDESAFERRITVPFCYQSKLSGIGETEFHDVVWYARTFEHSSKSAEERLLLHFGAVDYRATVWVNGVQVAYHEGGHTPFSADIIDALMEGTNTIVVRAEDPSRDVTIPRGKQYWKEESEGIFYTRTTGIWQTVWLEPVSRRRVGALRLTPEVDVASLDMEVCIEGVEAGMSLRVVVELNEEVVLEDLVAVRSSLLERRLPLTSRGEAPDASRLAGWDGGLALWSPETPNLYDIKLELLDDGGEILDLVESYFGMRKVEIRNREIYLNGRPLYQRLILDQGYFPEGILTAPTDDDLRRDIELTKEMGFNGVRKHQKVEDPRWLYWADTLGLLVWGEMANAYRYSKDYVRRITVEWQETLRRDHNHPCIVAWVPVNESWGVPNLATEPEQVEHLLAMYHLTRSLDGSRPVISNDGWEHARTDILALHDYRDAESLAKTYATLETALAAAPANRPAYAPGYGYHGEPILVTEFGGIAFSGGDGKDWGYSTVADTEEFLKRYEALIDALLNSEIVQGFCYTQLTDVEQEVNGLLTYGREPKADFARIREITTKKRL